MAFRFSLEALLRIRQSLEAREELLLQAANRSVVEMQTLVEDLDCYAESCASQRRAELTQGMSAVELQFELLRQDALQALRKKFCAQLQARTAARDRQAESYRQARAQREILQCVRDRQLQEYREEQLRQEQRAQDDLFLLRRGWLQRG